MNPLRLWPLAVCRLLPLFAACRLLPPLAVCRLLLLPLPLLAVCCLLSAVLTSAPASAEDLPQPPTPSAAPALPCQIDILEITGLWRTSEAIVRRELPWRPGEQVSAEKWALGQARLWNMGLFSQVRAQLENRDGKVVALLALEERWTINPLFSFQVLVKRAGSGDSSSWWSVGASDLNVGGQFVEAAAAYEQFNAFAGGLAYLRAHRFLGERADAMLLWERLVRPRLGFADRRMRLRGEANRLLDSDRWRVGGRLDAQWDDIFDAGDGPVNLPLSSKSVIADVGARYGRVDVQRIRQVGQSVELRAAAGATTQGDQLKLHTQLWGQALGFWAVGARWNVAARAQAGWQSGAVEALQFFVGGLYEVRGVRDSYLRADRYALANLELRMTALDTMWLAVVPALFSDAAVARDLQRGTTLIASAGGGVRLLVPRFVRTGLRIDVAVPLAGIACNSATQQRFCPGLSLGVFQYF